MPDKSDVRDDCALNKYGPKATLAQVRQHFPKE